MKHKTQHTKLSQKQVALKERLLKVYRKHFGFGYHHPGWATGLWSRKTEEIYDYIEKRFNATKDVVEYYSCMVYLLNVIPDHELLVEWADSPQRMGTIRTIVKTDYVTDRIASDRMSMKSTINHVLIN